MTDRAWFITAIGGLLALALLLGIWWRMYRRIRHARDTELGKATRQEFHR